MKKLLCLLLSICNAKTRNYEIPLILQRNESVYSISVYYNATIYSMDPQINDSAMAVQNGTFLDFGSVQQLQARYPESTFVNLEGFTVVPGLIDAHGHLLPLGKSLRNARIVNAASASSVCAQLIAFLDANPIEEGEWLLGRGWDQNYFPGAAFPTAQDLDDNRVLSKYKIVLSRIDEHAVWVNKRVMDGLDIPITDPNGGQIIRDANGIATGVFIDTASELIQSQIPPPSDTELHLQVQAAMKELVRFGITGIHDAGVSSAQLDIFKQSIDLATFPVRSYAMLYCPSETPLCGLNMTRFTGYGDGKLSLRSVKLFIDGALGSFGAAMDQPYTDDPSKSGTLMGSEEYFTMVIQAYIGAGWQVNSHAIGDKANRIILNAYESALRNLSGPDLRHRVEHAQIVSLIDIQRFGQLGIIPSMQPTHATSDMNWAEGRIGSERIKGAYAWQKMLQAGVKALPLSSDFPIESVNPMLGFYAAVTRLDVDGDSPQGPGGWCPEECLSRYQALKGFTLDAAYASHSESTLGSMSRGKRADFVVLDRDIMRIDPSLIPSTRVLLTIIDGDVVYRNDGTDWVNQG